VDLSGISGKAGLSPNSFGIEILDLGVESALGSSRREFSHVLIATGGIASLPRLSGANPSFVRRRSGGRVKGRDLWNSPAAVDAGRDLFAEHVNVLRGKDTPLGPSVPTLGPVSDVTASSRVVVG